ncbi:alpha/beta fold hydrolase [Pacificimonas sp. ICDLI1SI03]
MHETINRTLAALSLLGVLAMPAHAETPAVAGCPAEGEPRTEWRGISSLQGGKGYADTPMGQVHYRLVGPEDGRVIVLLHQTPWSMIQFADIQACLAAQGVRSLAIDTPGYGMSDRPPGEPSLAEYADNILPVLDTVGIDRAVFAGHHTGAGIAVAFAAAHPTRTGGLLLHGIPLYSEEERRTRLAKDHSRRELSTDGSHFSDYFASIRDYIGGAPGTAVTATWSTIAWYLAGEADIAHNAVFTAPTETALRAVTAPVLILSDEQDSLAANDRRAATLQPSFRFQQFSDGYSHSLMLDPARWARIAAEFSAEIAAASP